MAWAQGSAVFGGLSEGAGFVLKADAQVDGTGVFLEQIVSNRDSEIPPAIRIADAPAAGQALLLSRARIRQALQKADPDLVTTNWSGADQVRVIRRARSFGEVEFRELLAATLQRELVKDRGELEVRLNRPWVTVHLPDEPISLRILDLPTTGVSPFFIVRFEVRTAQETLGTWQEPVQAKVWREVWTARSAVRRGQSLREADLARERRDVLAIREPLADFAAPDAAHELAENLPAGALLYARSVKLRPVVRRGQSADAFVQDGALSITLKVEVLEDGAPGQVVRIRNPQSRRELLGKVHNEQTLLVTF